MKSPCANVDQLKDVVDKLSEVKQEVQKAGQVDRAVFILFCERLTTVVAQISKYMDRPVVSHEVMVGDQVKECSFFDKRGGVTLYTVVRYSDEKNVIGETVSLILLRSRNFVLINTKVTVLNGVITKAGTDVTPGGNSWFVDWLLEHDVTPEKLLSSIHEQVVLEISRSEKRLVTIRRRATIIEDMLEVATTSTSDPKGYKRVSWADVKTGDLIYLPGGGRHKVRPYGPFVVRDANHRELSISGGVIFPYSRSYLLTDIGSC